MILASQELGGILRNLDRMLIRAFAGIVTAAHHLEAELQAPVRGIEICIELGCSKIFIEGDCHLLVEMLQSHGDLSREFHITWHSLIQNLEHFDRWDAGFSKWDANKAADSLSRLYCPTTQVFSLYLPPMAQNFYMGVLKDERKMKGWQLYFQKYMLHTDGEPSAAAGVQHQMPRIAPETKGLPHA